MTVFIPKKLHKRSDFDAFPPLAHNKVITYHDLSPTQKKLLAKKLGSKKAAFKYRSKKLVSTLEPKKKYKVHYLMLKKALSLGVRLKSVHRCISFQQERFSQEFLQFMTERRKASKSKLEERQWYDS